MRLNKSAITGIVCLSLFAVTQGHAEPKGWSVNSAAMFFFNSTEQGGSGPSGSTLLTQTEVIFSGKWWSLGVFYQFDKQGSDQTDSGLGPKAELHWKFLYAEFGYSLIMNRAFTDRSIAKQTGNGMYFGVGVRFPLKGGAGARSGKGAYLQFNYKYRTQNINAQDGVDLDQPITQVDGYPTFGIGYDF